MFPVKLKLNDYTGITYWLIRPDDGQIIPTFINLPIELRRRLNSQISDPVAIVDLALQRYWVIVAMQRTTVKVRGITQHFRGEVLAEQRTFGGKIRAYRSTYHLLRQLEKFTGGRLPLHLRIFSFHDNRKREIASHLSSSADFARIYMHTLADYNRPIERS